jgi:hypothetical protein
MHRRTVAVLAAFFTIVITVAAFAQKNSTVLVRLFRLEGKQQVMLLEASEVSIDRSVPWQAHRSSDGDEPSMEFTAGEPKTLSVELMFDLFEERGGVSEKVKPIEDLTAVDPALQRPAMVQLEFAKNQLPPMKGVVESVGTKYTMFLPDGTPVRATVHLKMKAASKATTKQGEPCP